MTQLYYYYYYVHERHFRHGDDYMYKPRLSLSPSCARVSQILQGTSYYYRMCMYKGTRA